MEAVDLVSWLVGSVILFLSFLQPFGRTCCSYLKQQALNPLSSAGIRYPQMKVVVAPSRLQSVQMAGVELIYEWIEINLERSNGDNWDGTSMLKRDTRRHSHQPVFGNVGKLGPRSCRITLEAE